jgi:hypothetical protein
MRKTVIKSLYLFLCSILGMVLLTMLHRAIFVLYELLLTINYGKYSFGMSEGFIMALDFFTLVIALFFGGWYGTALGLDWYARIYGVNSEYTGGLFHGFVPHNWRGAKSSVNKPSISTASKTMTSKPTVSVTPSATSTTVHVPVSEKPTREWSFEELLESKAAATAASKKRAAKKTVAKKTTKRTTKTVTSTPKKPLEE